MKQVNSKHIKEMIQEAASEYVWGVKNPTRAANQYKIKVLKQVIKEELSAVLDEGGVTAGQPPEREEDYLPMISSNRPVSSFNRKELKMALAEIPKLKNPAYADALGQHGNQWIENVYIRAAEMGLYTPPTGADLRRQKGLPDPMQEADEGEEVMAAIEDVPQAAEKIAEKVRAEVEAMAEPSGLDPSVLMQAVAALMTAD